MAYTPTYTEDDVAPVVVDNALKVGVGIGTFSTVIGLLVGVGIGFWAFRKIKG